TPGYPAGQEISGPGSDGQSTMISAYHGTVYILLPITIAAGAAPGPRTLSLALTTQACDKDSCFPPVTQKLEIESTIAADSAAPAEQKDPAVFAAAERQTFAAERE